MKKFLIIFLLISIKLLALNDGLYEIGEFQNKTSLDINLQSNNFISYFPFTTYISIDYKTRRISKGEVFNPDPVLESTLKLSKDGFYTKLNRN